MQRGKYFHVEPSSTKEKQKEKLEPNLSNLLETEMRVMPHPILQHHPTRHKIIVANWLRPMIEFITKAQNLESPSQSSLYLVRPQQQQHTNKPLIIVPRSLNMVARNTAIFNDIKPPWQNNDKQLFSS